MRTDILLIEVFASSTLLPEAEISRWGDFCMLQFAAQEKKSGRYGCMVYGERTIHICFYLYRYDFTKFADVCSYLEKPFFYVEKFICGSYGHICDDYCFICSCTYFRCFLWVQFLKKVFKDLLMYKKSLKINMLYYMKICS